MSKVTWHVPHASKNYRLSFQRHIARQDGGEAQEYVPVNFHLPGSVTNLKTFCTDNLDLYRGKAVVVVYDRRVTEDIVRDDPHWKNLYGEGGNPNAFERLLNVDRWNLRS